MGRGILGGNGGPHKGVVRRLCFHPNWVQNDIFFLFHDFFIIMHPVHKQSERTNVLGLLV